MSYEAEGEVYQIDIKLTGEREVKSLTDAIEREEQGLRNLIAAMDQHERAAVASSSAAAGLRAKVSEVGAAASGSSQKLLMIGNVLDDLQYVGEQGLRPIINNVMQISPVVGMALLAIDQLYRHWDQLMGLMGVGFPQPALTGPELLAANLKKAQHEMEELAKKARLTFTEVERMAKLKVEIEGLKKTIEDQKTVDSALKVGPEDEQQRGQGFGKALAESGGKLIHDDYETALENRKDAKGLVFNPVTGQMAKPADVTRDVFAAALAGDKIARDAITSELADHKQFTKNVERFDPKEIEKNKKEADALNREAAENMAAYERDKKEQEGADAAAEQAEREHEDRKVRWELAHAGDAQEASDKDSAHRVKRARESAPGVDDLIRNQLKQMGGSEDAAGKLMAKLTPRFGALEASKLVRDQVGGAREDLMKDALKAPDVERRNSQVIGSEGLANSIQSAVGGPDDTATKQLKEAQAQTALLNMIANGRRTPGASVFGADGQLRGGN